MNLMSWMGLGSAGSGTSLEWTQQTNLCESNSFRTVVYLNSNFIIGLDSVVRIASSPTSDVTTWGDIHAVSFSAPVYHVAHNGSDQYVAVGGYGNISTSSDGTTWTLRTSGTSNCLYGVAYGNSMYVAVGYRKTLLTSTDGISWTDRSVSDNAYFKGIVYGGSKFVAIGNDNISYSSTDGITWTKGSAGYLYCITYGNSLYVAGGHSGKIMTSSDGNTWTSQTSGVSRRLTGASYGNSLYVLTGYNGQIITSPDGVTWTSRLSGETINVLGVDYDGASKFLAVGAAGGALTSSDGITWNGISTKFELDGGDYAATRACLDASLCISVGNYGKLYTASSSDLTSWTSRNSGITDSLYSINGDGSLYVAVGANGQIITSTDGVSWTTRTSGTTNVLRDITYDGSSQYVVVDDSGEALTSPDGITWTVNTLGVSSDYMKAVAYGNSTYVAVGRDSGGTDFIIYSSSDGITWNQVEYINSGYGYSGVAYGNSTFVAVGSGGRIETSPDGTTWTVQASGTTDFIYDIDYSSGKFICCLPDYILSSTDGIAWTSEFHPGYHHYVSMGNSTALVGYNSSILKATI